MKPTAAVAVLVVLVSILVLGAEPAGAVPPDTSPWIRVSAGDFHTCGIRASGRLYCWGLDTYGELGNGGGDESQPAPVEVFGGGTNWRAVAVGQAHTCARTSSFELFCWGRDDFGQVGDGGPNVDQHIPTEVVGGFIWMTVAAGQAHTCAREASGRLLCWGDDTYGALGDGAGTASQPAPVPVAGDRRDWTSFTVGAAHTCARRANGRLFCWGADYNGQVGDGGHDFWHVAPVQVAGARTDWASVSAGFAHTCARRSSGRLFCWGTDSFGQLGDGHTTERHAPVQVIGGRTDWSTVTTGEGHTCARRTSGRLFCWGSDFRGGLGNGAPNADRHLPSEVAGARTDWVTVEAGGTHTCARRSGGALFCWGRDGEGEVGNGAPYADRPSPSPVP